jgi:hypothetical protein
MGAHNVYRMCVKTIIYRKDNLENDLGRISNWIIVFGKVLQNFVLCISLVTGRYVPKCGGVSVECNSAERLLKISVVKKIEKKGNAEGKFNLWYWRDKILIRYSCIHLHDFTASQTGTKPGQALPIAPHYIPMVSTEWPHWSCSKVFFYSASADRRVETIIDNFHVLSKSQQAGSWTVLQIRTRCNKSKCLNETLMV